jgi:hypothetical protein
MIRDFSIEPRFDKEYLLSTINEVLDKVEVLESCQDLDGCEVHFKCDGETFNAIKKNLVKFCQSANESLDSFRITEYVNHGLTFEDEGKPIP